LKLLSLRKPGTISILAILFYTQLGYYGQFVIQQWVLKEEAREAWIAALPDRCFFRVRLADVNAAGHWEEEGKECWYNNHLYDVIREKDDGGVLWLYCMDDEREAKLIRRSGEMTHSFPVVADRGLAGRDDIVTGGQAAGSCRASLRVPASVPLRGL
jgi:hypothetical protein